MNTRVHYRDIPKAERKLLAAEVYRLTPILRIMQLAVVLFPVIFSGFLVDFIAPKSESILVRVAVVAVSAAILSTIVWGIFGRPMLKAEVEKLKNA